MEIRRGTTPTISIDVDFDTSLIESIYITLSQNASTVIEKSLMDCSFTENLIEVILTQEETLLLKANKIANIQARIKLRNGIVVSNEIQQILIQPILKEGMI